MPNSNKNPREPRNVKRLIAESEARLAGKAKPQKPPINAVHETKPKLWAKFWKRGQ